MAAAILVLWSNDTLAATLPDSTVTAIATATTDPITLSQQPTPTRPSVFSQPAMLPDASHAVLSQQLVEDTDPAVPLLRPVPTHPLNFGHPAQFPVMAPAPNGPNAAPFASPLNGPGTVADRMPPSSHGLVIEKSYPLQKNEGVYTAFANYKGQRSFLKCAKDEERFKAERDALLAIHAGNAEKYGFQPSVKSAFVRILDSAKTPDGVYCVILERLDGINLRQFASMLTLTQRSKILPLIFVQFIKALQYMHRLGWMHGDIKPANIIITRGVNNMPKVTIINFDWAQMAGKEMRPSVGGTHGYRPPEDYLDDPNRLLNQYARDSWMIGATIYASFTGAPPYGFSYDPHTKKSVTWASDQMKSEMLKIRDTGVNTCKNITFSSSIRLLALMKMLMVPKFEMRSLVTQLSSAVLTVVAQTKVTPDTMQKIWERIALHINVLGS
ncbi:kinase-like domain-containing protein [Thamnocephalis sphaerospora]|uniref:Kinase-like domain-containing protein n=1 Tax=Thamnocephalis sphaerospora TaxID=78915 RepID=A0A4P9XMM2_9FUNG|nr:kinase-like domain-containing protein [Thamnocephalis sphaerospora]|eukprot:RKP07126.1 kinase-like domain-containing protein [Thamnocephalis sphaerospora]